jgi:endonuclease III
LKTSGTRSPPRIGVGAHAVAGTSTRWGAIVDTLPDDEFDSTNGHPLGNKGDPYDELVYILLTVMTRSQPRIDRAYDALARLTGGGSWSALLDVPADEVRALLKPLGFVNRRTEQLLEIVRRIEEEHGGSLGFLRDLPDDEVLAFLTSLPGVGEKSAKCVLMYSLGRDVLPVDIHVLRVAKRLGLIPEDASWAKAAAQLEREVPDDLKYAVHVGFVIHGREVCKGPNPQCHECVLVDLCPSGLDAPRLRSAYAS